MECIYIYIYSEFQLENSLIDLSLKSAFVRLFWKTKEKELLLLLEREMRKDHV
jgi:hypothetical protein